MNPICQKCGLCCDGYTFWMTDKQYEGKEEIDSISSEYITFWMANRDYDNDEIEVKKLMEYHGLHPLKNESGKIGLTVRKNNIRFLKNIKGELGIHIQGKCMHFDRIDGKAFCKIYENRPIVCRGYYCQMAIDLGNKLGEVKNGVYL